jgi:hypothetical protein
MVSGFINVIIFFPKIFYTLIYISYKQLFVNLNSMLSDYYGWGNIETFDSYDWSLKLIGGFTQSVSVMDLVSCLSWTATNIRGRGL